MKIYSTNHLPLTGITPFNFTTDLSCGFSRSSLQVNPSVKCTSTGHKKTRYNGNARRMSMRFSLQVHRKCKSYPSPVIWKCQRSFWDFFNSWDSDRIFPMNLQAASGRFFDLHVIHRQRLTPDQHYWIKPFETVFVSFYSYRFISVGRKVTHLVFVHWADMSRYRNDLEHTLPVSVYDFCCF